MANGGPHDRRHLVSQSSASLVKYASASTAVAQNLRNADVKIEAVYLDPVFEFQARGRLLLVPMQFLILAIGVALSPASIRAWRTMKGHHA